MIDWLLLNVSEVGYLGVFLTMTLVFSFVPFPSQVVLLPAGFLASQGEFNLFLIILSGTLGGIAGAHINYYLANRLGRRVVLRYGRYVMISEGGLHKAEKFFDDYGQFSILIGLITPGIGQLITLPAGLAAMDRVKFFVSVVSGALLWNALMVLLGYYFGEHQSFLLQKWPQILMGLFAAVTAIVLIYVCIKRRCFAAEKPR
ncbi:MAG: DedA family protein [Campylobacterales bacterium]